MLKWKKDLNKDWTWRNLAVKYFNLQKGEIIHHLRETEEQRDFNDNHYERWGFDFDSEMKYAIKMTAEEHNKYHYQNEETKQKRLKTLKQNNKKWIITEEHRKKLSAASKGKSKSKDHIENNKKARQWYFNQGPSKETNKKRSDTMKQKYTDGELFSEEHRKNLSIAAKKRTPMSEETKNKIRNTLKNKIKL